MSATLTCEQFSEMQAFTVQHGDWKSNPLFGSLLPSPSTVAKFKESLNLHTVHTFF